VPSCRLTGLAASSRAAPGSSCSHLDTLACHDRAPSLRPPAPCSCQVSHHPRSHATSPGTAVPACCRAHCRQQPKQWLAGVAPAPSGSRCLGCSTGCSWSYCLFRAAQSVARCFARICCCWTERGGSSYRQAPRPQGADSDLTDVPTASCRLDAPPGHCHPAGPSALTPATWFLLAASSGGRFRCCLSCRWHTNQPAAACLLLLGDPASSGLL